MKKLHVEFDAIVSDRTYKELKEVSYVDCNSQDLI
uniref:Uncharacterized protein n=1 Tax=Dulem virus 40 TaxID=3145758 RepID=A0AAU8AWX0_9CAUD